MKALLQKRFSGSVMQAILWSLVAIVSLSVMTLVVSYALTESGDQDAFAINHAGSMRMQTLRVALEVQKEELSSVRQAVGALDEKWRHPIFTSLRLHSPGAMADAYQQLYEQWAGKVQPRLLKFASGGPVPRDQMVSELLIFVDAVDSMVSMIQAEAERRLLWQRVWQVMALFLTVSLGAYVIYMLRHRVQVPLTALTSVARQIGQGDFSQRVAVSGRDELALLADTINHTCDEIARMYGDLEQRVVEKTEALSRSNTTLQFLFDAARTTLEKELTPQDYQTILDRLADLLQISGLELCLFTDRGQRPYQQIALSESETVCAATSCDACQGSAAFVPLKAEEELRLPIARSGEPAFGVLKVVPGARQLRDWEIQLTQSVADQIALAMSSRNQKEQERRLTLYQERSVIARELHDSLAQSLSYLKIQVTRLQKSYDAKATDQVAPIIEELREGLNGAYRQLRELLTTFRLKVAGDGLRDALQGAMAQLREQSAMNMQLDYRLDDVPLTATEEIHLVQIAREAAQNAVKHSKGSMVRVQLERGAGRAVRLSVEDDGVGIPNDPGKLNHYGLAIMLERSRSLGGELQVSRRQPSGTSVVIEFMPRVFASTGMQGATPG